YGGGFYDRLLAQPAVSALRVGVGYDLQWAKSLPALPHDQPLHLMITEQGVWDCRQPPLLSPGDAAGAWEGTS
ncbi:5-formyltetrahydrofolate cyclo-ligase, partial [Alicyclobacillaceae bacterium I2511]